MLEKADFWPRLLGQVKKLGESGPNADAIWVQHTNFFISVMLFSV